MMTLLKDQVKKKRLDVVTEFNRNRDVWIFR